MSDDNLPAVAAAQAPERTRVKVDISRPLADLDEAFRVSDALSRSELVPESLRGKPASILHVLMTGQEMGLKWPVALRVIYSPGPGQIGIRGQFLLAKLREAGHDYEWEEGDDSCTFTIHRDWKSDPPGRTYSAAFTIDDAVAAGLAERKDDGTVVALSKYGKPLPWQQYQKSMLFWRAVSQCVTRAAPEVALGFEIQGADAPAGEAPAEVVLTPQSPAPAAGEAAPGGPEQDSARSRLEELDAQMATGLPPAPPPPPGVPARAGRPRSARARLEAGLSVGFAELGWDAATESANILRACSTFARRRITAMRDLTETEMERLRSQLDGIASAAGADTAGPVFLAEAADRWEEDWQEADFAGHHVYEHDAEA